MDVSNKHKRPCLLKAKRHDRLNMFGRLLPSRYHCKGSGWQKSFPYCPDNLTCFQFKTDRYERQGDAGHDVKHLTKSSRHRQPLNTHFACSITTKAAYLQRTPYWRTSVSCQSCRHSTGSRASHSKPVSVVLYLQIVLDKICRSVRFCLL